MLAHLWFCESFQLPAGSLQGGRRGRAQRHCPFGTAGPAAEAHDRPASSPTLYGVAEEAAAMNIDLEAGGRLVPAL
jgi:hypothetical protein